MTESIISITAAQILKIAFGEFLKSGVGEIAKQLTGDALSRVKELREKLATWFKSKQDHKAEKALDEIQEQGSQHAFNKMITYLEDEMEANSALTHELRQIAQQIVTHPSYQVSNRQYNNFGRDMINVENIHGNPQIGGT